MDTRRGRHACRACGALLCSALTCQVQFADLTRQQVQGEDTTTAITLADVDRDGDLDVVTANGGWVAWERIGLWLNDGRGSFQAAPERVPDQRHLGSSIAAGDLDRDGDIDLVLGVFGYGVPDVRNRVLFNDGEGTFRDVTETVMPAWTSTCATFQLSDATRDVVLLDADRDGDLDLYFANWCQDRLFLNDGTGHFFDATIERLPIDADQTNAVAAGDLDGDGDVDLALGNMATATSTGRNRLYLNDGSGRFVDRSDLLPWTGGTTMAVAIGDIDRDRDLDILFGSCGFGYGAEGRQATLLTNDGQGRFVDVTRTHLPLLPTHTQAVLFFDCDSDGDLDLALGNGAFGVGYQERLYVNDGLGRFRDATERLPVDRDETNALAAGDLDGDGDSDLVIGNFGPRRVLMNLHRHVQATRVARVGDRYTLRYTASPGYLTRPQIVRAGVAAGTARLPLGPFGEAGLDPSTLIELKPTVLLAPAGLADHSFFVPMLPELRGLRFYVQGLVLPDHLRFTNVWADLVVD
jgi:hypothetical protein